MTHSITDELIFMIFSLSLWLFHITCLLDRLGCGSDAEEGIASLLAAVPESERQTVDGQRPAWRCSHQHHSA